jgi:EAL domain-containing protein (putative c-di-GMP-specific phosphodiesterase class I)
MNTSDQRRAGSLVAVLSLEDPPRLVHLTGDHALTGHAIAPVTFGELLEAIAPNDRDRLLSACRSERPARLELHRAHDGHPLYCHLTLGNEVAFSRGMVLEPIERDAARPMHWRLTADELRHAMQSEAFEAWFQPIYSLAQTPEIKGYEVLARWRRESGEVLGADDFIPALRGQGMMRDFGRWIRQTATTEFFAKPRGALTLSINLAAADLLQPGLIEEVEKLIDHHALARDALRLEITECEFIDELNTVAEVMGALREAGASLALDDFGAGYSSFTWLERFPVQVVKIDRHFMHTHGQSDTSTKIVRSIIELAHDLDIEVVAEGVEQAETLEWLRQMGCDMAQGYWLGAALPFDALALD